MSDFLLELRCEEIPARMQAKARADLEKLFTAQLKDAGLEARSITTYSTPRRLALIARGLPKQTEAVREERKGPRADAPEQALSGFLRSTGLSRDDLVERDVKGKTILFAVIEKPGQPTTDILAAAIPAIIAAFPWPKSQRWGEASISSESLRWVRPLSSIIALFDSEIVDFEVHGIKSGRTTMGHRFMANSAVHAEPVETRETSSNTLRQAQGERTSNIAICIETVDEYLPKLRAAHVIVDHEERQNIVRDGAAKAASDAGLSLVEDEGLVIENAGLTEWPVPLLGRFDEAFLDVPEEVIQLTTRINQKYFVAREKQGDSSGALTNAFVCTANIDAIDGGAAIVAGNEKVLAARLADAKFFWELDQKTPLAVHAEKLSNIVFHEKLGTVADKVERVAKLARWLCEEGIVTNTLGNSARHAETGSASGETLKQVQGDEVGVQGGVGGRNNTVRPEPVAKNTVRPEPVAKNTVCPEPVEGQGVHASTSSARTANKLADLAEQAARLCKADLVTEMVGEFPELQGLMGGYYARAEGKRNGYLLNESHTSRHAELGSASPADNDAVNNETLKQVQGDEVGVQGDEVAVKSDDLGESEGDEPLVTTAKAGVQNDGNSLTDAEIDMIADAIRDHYKPVGQSDDVPTAPVTVAVSLADKLDTLFGFFAVRLHPTGSKDPFALRRTSISICNLLVKNKLRLPMQKIMRFAMYELVVSVSQFLMISDNYDFIEDSDHFAAEAAKLRIVASPEDLNNYLGEINAALFDGTAAISWFHSTLDFIMDRLKVQQKEAGVRHDLIDAVFALGGEDDLVRLLARVHALQDFVTTDDGVNLLAGYKRASNILKKEGDENMRHAELGSASIAPETLKQVQGDEVGVQPERMFEAPADEPEQSTALQEALNAAEPKAAAAIQSEDFAGAMRALASLRAPIDEFFDNVMVNDTDAAKKKYRLGLLSRFRDAVHRVADFAKIEG